MKIIVQSLLVSTMIAAVSRAAPLIQPLYQPAGENPTVLGRSSGLGTELTTATVVPEFSLLQTLRIDGVSIDQEGDLVHHPKKYANKPLTCNDTTAVGTIWQEISEVTNVYAEYDNMVYKVGFSSNASEPFTLTRQDRMTIMPEELERIQSALSEAKEQNNSTASAPATADNVIEVRLDDNWTDLMNEIGCAFANNEIDTYRRSEDL
ncbi:hypothetical protein MP228_002481 [Amoeboaphelidium protococcarum]|nr:hypothetical protein MP228_002481 [Amoeboaphelidium protococcarum]